MEIRTRPLIIVAPDSFKESLSAQAACDWIEKGILKAVPFARIVKIPLADGGEGTLHTLCRGGKILSEKVPGPLGTPVRAKWGMLPDKSTAVIEIAQASGLALVPPRKRNPLRTSSFGTGILIAAALKRGAKKIILTLGGVATNDAGCGMARALGFRFFDSAGKEIPEGAGGLKFLHRIDASQVHPRLNKINFFAACDVKNPLCGPKGSAEVYGPQKGATPAMVRAIDSNLRHLAKIIKRDLGTDILNLPGAGAAGGAGAGAVAFFGAKLKRGIDLVLQSADFENKMKSADIIISGEGKIDRQTLYGKTLSGVARLALKHRVPLIAFCGQTEKGFENILNHGVTQVFSISAGGTSVRESMRRAGPLLKACVVKNLTDIMSVINA